MRTHRPSGPGAWPAGSGFGACPSLLLDDVVPCRYACEAVDTVWKIELPEIAERVGAGAGMCQGK